MSTKTITLSEDAYEKLKALKQGSESFSEVVRKLTTRKPLTEFAGLLTAKEAARAEEIIKTGRTDSRLRAEQLQKGFKDDS